ncbi:putative dimethylaniline monooxygenase [Paraphaeosphaeria sporulosa]|uniref:Putative dimethylaniline monooxygenase n=1 Tax=Paraphaeosphaeria sporulosa TaxID=1460663 RepID=A0A177CT59_9PLEO|nr:putative dimethylaniline monooxygenase [Paraphaeosphaeria sporulosa]OAG10080.1 putative dimethylaniline monooxygenase [Paraphaeosphaeria sporulosa]
MAQQTVAVVGTGACGLSMLKTLREDGFKVTAFERRKQVGGLWAYTKDATMTTALPSTRALISKYTCGMSDFPMPDHYPPHLTQAQFQEFMESYAKHFDLLKDIVFDAALKRVSRNEDDTKWRVELLVMGEIRVEEFDKVALCHGYQTYPQMPKFEDEKKFEGILMHAQQFRPEDVGKYKGKNVVMVGMSSTASDVINNILPHASKMYVSHRRGMYIFPTWRDNKPADLLLTWRRRQTGFFLQRNFPSVAQWLGDKALDYLVHKSWGYLDPEWRILPSPSVSLSLPGASDYIIPLLKTGKITSLHGIKRFLGPSSIEFTDGTILEDIDAVICATGYAADLTVAPFLETSRPPDYAGPELPRLWHNIFPPKYADSMALLCHSAYGKNNGFSFNDVQSMAVSNIFRGSHPLPSLPTRESDIDAHHAWLATRWAADKTEGSFDRSMVRNWEFQGFLHEAAGTGMESLGWGVKGWKFWIRDPKMSWLMNHGVETAHAFRYFETGKRKTWDGAREAIIKVNEAVNGRFPVKREEDLPEYRKEMLRIGRDVKR